MIRWLQKEDCEGRFNSSFFCHDENGGELSVYVKSPDLTECAEKCVEAFNTLSESMINEICEKLISCAKEGGINKKFKLPVLDHALDILNDCWFIALYVDMASQDDEVAYVVEGEGNWGETVGFVIRNNKVIYVGVDCFKYMKNVE